MDSNLKKVKKYDLLIVGLGSIGWRHLESISNLSLRKKIHILDKFTVIENVKKK